MANEGSLADRLRGQFPIIAGESLAVASAVSRGDPAVILEPIAARAATGSGTSVNITPRARPYRPPSHGNTEAPSGGSAFRLVLPRRCDGGGVIFVAVPEFFTRFPGAESALTP